MSEIKIQGFVLKNQVKNKEKYLKKDKQRANEEYYEI